MTARFTIDAPLASTDSWVGRMSGKAKAAEAIFRKNMARRDQAAREYGEPETPHEFYAGRPGSKAERVVLHCLRELLDIPEADRLYAHELTDAISAVYLDLAWAAPRQRDAVKIHRRTMALMRLAAGEQP